MDFKHLKGRPVVGAGGRAIGEVHDLEVDLETWRVTHLILRITATAVSDLGIRKPLWSRALLTMPVLAVQATADAMVLNRTIEELAELVGTARNDDDG